MSPQLFFILLLLAVAITGSCFVLFLAYYPRKKSMNAITTEEIKTYFEDAPLQVVIQNLKQYAKKQFSCRKCNSHRFDINRFDEDIYEIYCLDCGLKYFYHVDLLAGLNRTTKRSKSPWPKEWIKDINDDTCYQCHSHEHSQFKMKLDVRYKIGGYGFERKLIVFLINSCKKCGLINFFNAEKSPS